MTNADKNDGAYTVQSLEKTIDILDFFAEHQELGTRELARMTG